MRMTTLEKAQQVGNDPARLRKELKEARSCLVRELRAKFHPGRMCLEEKRLYSDNGEYVLEWRTREYPDAPESYDNQQNSRGVVLCLKVR